MIPTARCFFMPKFLRYAVLVSAVILVVWGVYTLTHPAQKGPFVVVLDAGHGGDDPGAAVGETYEKDINFAVALLVRERLAQQEDVTVLMTRGEDVFISLSDRAAFANDARADLFVSIHANALENNTEYAGIMTFYHPNKLSSKKPAQFLQTAICGETGAIDRSVRSEDYAVLRETDMPAVLVETGFMTCPEELALLTDGDYQAKLADGIAQGILKYLRK